MRCGAPASTPRSSCARRSPGPGPAAPTRCGRCSCGGSAATAALARRRRGQPPRGSRGCAPLPLPRSLLPESSAGSGASSCIGLWLKRRSSCLSPSLGAYGLVSRTRRPEQHHEEPEREASRCLVRAASTILARSTKRASSLRLRARFISSVRCSAEHDNTIATRATRHLRW